MKPTNPPSSTRIKIERNIVQKGERYFVEVTRRRAKIVARASFATLAEAQSYRDAVEAQLPQSPTGEAPGATGPVALGPKEYQRRRRARLIAECLCPSCSGPNPEQRSRCRDCAEFYKNKRRPQTRKQTP